MPDTITASIASRTNLWKQLPDGWLRVTVKVEAAGTLVVTITRRKRGPEA